MPEVTAEYRNPAFAGMTLEIEWPTSAEIEGPPPR